MALADQWQAWLEDRPQRKWQNDQTHECRRYIHQAHDICRERGKVYGHPKEDFDKIAHIWEVIFRVPVN